METILNILSSVSGVVGGIGAIASAIRALLTLRDRIPTSINLNRSSKENQLGDCDTAQRIIDRRRLILRAKQDAKKRPRTFIDFYCLIILLCASMLIYGLLPPLIKEALESSYSFMFLYITYLLALIALVIFVFPLFLFNAPTWTDLIKRSQDKYSICASRQKIIKEAIEEAIRETNKETEKAERKPEQTIKKAIEGVAETEKETRKEIEKAEKEAIKEAAIKKAGKVGKKAIKEVKKGYCLHISQVIDVASHFDTYLLLDADSRETFLKDGVIGAKGINEGEPICKVIESYLSENDTNDPKQAQGDVRKSTQTDKDTTVVFIYSRHGKASYKRTKEARAMCKDVCKDVFDLGPVCGEMRELEIVAHQLLYLQDEGCLRLPY